MTKIDLPFNKVISLGPSCETTYHIRSIVDQEEAYVFDWVIAQPLNVARAISNDFSDFIKPDGLTFNPGIEAGHPYIVDELLGIEFHHDFRNDQQFMETFPDVREKYSFLINRFRNVCLEDKPVLFVQQHATEQEAKAIEAALDKRFPTLEYRLLIVSFSQGWSGASKVIPVAIEYASGSWDARYPAWNRLLSDVLDRSFESGSLRRKMR